MKKYSLVFVIVLILSSCSSARIVPTATITTTARPTNTSTPTPKPTSTPWPTTTPIPPLPETIKFTFDPSVSEETQNKIKLMVAQAYWFYVGIGCSPDGFRAKFYTEKEGGEGGYTDTDSKGVWMEAGITSIESNPHKTTGSISHEIAHTMCQMAFTKSKPGQFGSIDLRWLTEALANYFSTWERITNTGSDFGYETIAEWETSLAYNGSSKYCGFSLALLERSDSDKIYQDQYYSAGHTATVLLTKTTPGGITALLNYYKFLNKDSASKAFQEAFGRTKEEFYKQYRDECINGFPTILSSGNPSTPIGQGCVSESSKDDKLTIHCLGRMAKDSLPTELQDREIIYGFEVTGIDPTTLVSDLKNIVSVPKNFLLAVDGNKLYVIIPQLAKSNDYYVNIALKDGSFASAIYHWEK